MRPSRAALVAVLVACGSLGIATATGQTPAPAHPAPCAPLTAGNHLLAVDSSRIPVVLHVPPHARAGGRLILGLPGAGQTAKDFWTYTGYSALADRKGFTVAYPTATGSRPYWNISGAVPGKPDDVAYLRQVIPAAVRAACADPATVGVTGVSNGGGMSARLACDAPDLVAAAAPVAGGYGSLPGCHPGRAVPMLEVHGVDDQIVPYNGKGAQRSGAVSSFLAQWRQLDGCTGAAQRRAVRANVVELRWSGCARGTLVVHDRIADAEHGWPGESDLDGARGFSSTQRTWSFLSSFRR